MKESKLPLRIGDQQHTKTVLSDAQCSTRRKRTRLTFGIDCQPEGDYSNDKRADIRVSVDNRIELPIEIKLDGNRDLEQNLRAQLIALYTHAPKADGNGIYLVFWFGARPGARKRRPPLDCPKALQARLESLLQPAERGRIHVRVMDISLPR